MGVTADLAHFVAETTYEGLPGSVVREAKRTLLEGIANALLGSGTKLGKTMAGVLTGVKEEPIATFIGTGVKGAIKSAAFYNTAITDCNDAAGGYWKGIVHPGKNVVPATLTVASAQGKSGKDLILAMILGIECYLRIDLVMAASLALRGQYDDGVVGTIGSAIAIGKLLGLDKKNIQGAIGNAAILSPCSIGGTSYFRSASRPLTMGQSSSSAITAVLMQQAGVHGPSEILECEGGFVRALSDCTDLSSITQDLGKEWECLYLYKKPFVGCRLTHSTREAAQLLKREHNIKAEDIVSVTIWAPKSTLIVTGHHTNAGANIVEHSCSGPYLHANVLMYDDTGPGCLGDERMNDIKVHELASRINIVEDPEATRLISKGYEWAYRGKIEIVTRGGKKYSYIAEHVKWDPFEGFAATDAELEEKLRIYAGGLLSQEKIDAIIRTVSNLEQLDNTAELMRLLA